MQAGQPHAGDHVRPAAELVEAAAAQRAVLDPGEHERVWARLGVFSQVSDEVGQDRGGYAHRSGARLETSAGQGSSGRLIFQ